MRTHHLPSTGGMALLLTRKEKSLIVRPQFPSQPVFVGRGIGPVWKDILRNYYELMGWDTKTGTPLPGTMKKLDFEQVISHTW
jgi:hypothetical protein